jgi:hypothetical protein
VRTPGRVWAEATVTIAGGEPERMQLRWWVVLFNVILVGITVSLALLVAAAILS